jgi:hypothetical protein
MLLYLSVTTMHGKSTLCRGIESEISGWTYFATNYGPEGRKCVPSEWATCYTAGSIAHNLYIERYHREFKRDTPRGSKMDDFMFEIQKYNIVATERHTFVSLLAAMSICNLSLKN